MPVSPVEKFIARTEQQKPSQNLQDSMEVALPFKSSYTNLFNSIAYKD